MKNSLIITSFFIAGILAGYFHWLPEGLIGTGLTQWILFGLIFLVGFVLGADPRLGMLIRSIRPSVLFVPLSVCAGSLVGSVMGYLVFPSLSFPDSLAIGAGFGYYSLSSIMIGELSGKTAAAIALITNIFREITTLLAAPLLVKGFGSMAPILSAGATAMDTTLPVIIRYSGKDFLFTALISGIILTILTPLLISLIYAAL
jgi:uncharacterized membrane protein YbjE (DUF340 family)